jgi:hypothetical protein
MLETFTCAVYISDQIDTYVHASKLMALQCSLLWLQYLSNDFVCMSGILKRHEQYEVLFFRKNKFYVTHRTETP